MVDNSLVVEGVNIADLSDEDISLRLFEFGFIPGPILETTRSVYQRKLARLMRNEEDDIGTGEEDDFDEEVQPSPVFSSDIFRDYTSPSTSYSCDELRRRPLPRPFPYSGNSFIESPVRQSPSKPWSLDDIVSQVEPPAGEMEKPLLSTTTKIICAAVLMFLSLLVYWNMESTPSNPFTAPPADP